MEWQEEVTEEKVTEEKVSEEDKEEAPVLVSQEEEEEEASVENIEGIKKGKEKKYGIQ